MNHTTEKNLEGGAPSSGVICEQPCSLDLNSRVGLLKLHPLKLAYRFTKLLSLERIGNRLVKCTLCKADHLPRDAYATFI